MERLVLRNMSLTKPSAASGATPTLLPLGLVSFLPSSLTLIDIRLVVNQQDFADYLAFFHAHQHKAAAAADDTGTLMHTVGGLFREFAASGTSAWMYSGRILWTAAGTMMVVEQVLGWVVASAGGQASPQHAG